MPFRTTPSAANGGMSHSFSATPSLDFVHLGGVGEDVGELSVNCSWGFSAVGFQPRQCNISVGQPQHEVRRFRHVSNFCTKSSLQKYEFAIRHLGRHVPPYGTSILILSEWSRTITITTELETPERPEATQNASGQASVSWDPVADATQYRLRLWTEDRWEELDGEDDGGVSVTMSGTTATVSGLPGDYYWYIFEVQALGPNGVQQSGWSPSIAVFNQHRQGR